MFDSHCHLHDPRMESVREAAIQRARAAGVRGFLLAGVDEPGWAVAADLAARHPELALCYGLHPQAVPGLPREELARQLLALARLCRGRGPLPRPVAVGELGLDRLTDETRACLDRQEEVFRAQLALAREEDLPLVLHIVRAHGQSLALLRRDGVPRAGGVVHSYSGGAELVPAYVELGLCISFAGPVTYAGARRLQAAARAVPRERLLVETDAPDQAPEPHRPGPSEPAFLPAIVAALARIRAEEPEDLGRYTEENARRLFRLPKE